MKTLGYTAAALIAIYLINRMFGFAVTSLIILGVICILLWKRRATILTQFANRAYFVNGDAKKGEKLYEKAYRTGEMSANCKIAYSSYCLRENKFEKGKRILNEIINSRYSTSEDKLGAKHNLAVLIWHEGNLDEAIELLESVHAQAPATNTYGTLGVLYLERAKKNGNAEKELEFMIEAYEYNEDDKTIADNLGELYYILGEYGKAKTLYEKLLQKQLYTPMPYYNYGRVLKAMGETERTREMFEKALSCRFTSVMTVTREQVERELAEAE